jgi:hypothetical protein
MPLYLGRNKIAGGSAAITIDDVLNSTSENPVQNKVIKAAIDSMDAATKQYFDNAKEIFIAEYGVTTIEEMKSAYDAGKMLFCKDGARILPLTSFSSNNPIFVGGTQNKRFMAYYSSSLAEWGKVDQDLVFAGHEHESDDIMYNGAPISVKVDELDSNMSQFIGDIGGMNSMINIKTEIIDNWILTEGYFGSSYISTGGTV